MWGHSRLVIDRPSPSLGCLGTNYFQMSKYLALANSKLKQKKSFLDAGTDILKNTFFLDDPPCVVKSVIAGCWDSGWLVGLVGVYLLMLRVLKR